MTSNKVEVAGERLPIRRIGHQRLKSVTFRINGREYMAIEQNAEKHSRWGQLAKEAHAVVQFKDMKRNMLRSPWTGERVWCKHSGIQ